MPLFYIWKNWELNAFFSKVIVEVDLKCHIFLKCLIQHHSITIDYPNSSQKNAGYKSSIERNDMIATKRCTACPQFFSCSQGPSSRIVST